MPVAVPDEHWSVTSRIRFFKGHINGCHGTSSKLAIKKWKCRIVEWKHPYHLWFQTSRPKFRSSSSSNPTVGPSPPSKALLIAIQNRSCSTQKLPHYPGFGLHPCFFTTSIVTLCSCCSRVLRDKSISGPHQELGWGYAGYSQQDCRSLLQE
jgi:hypothetical protein